MLRICVLLFLLASQPVMAGELTLTSSNANPRAGDSVTLTAETHHSGDLVGIFTSTQVDAGGNLISPTAIAFGLTDASGKFVQVHAVPSNQAGSTFHLKAFAISAGIVEQSGILTISVTDGSHTPPVAGIEIPEDSMRIAPHSILFSGLPSEKGDGEIVRWNWDFQDPHSSGPNGDEGFLVGHRFEHPGTYEVQLTVIDEHGLSDSTSITVNIAPFEGTTYYVSNAGQDGNDGLTPATAWRTLGHAVSHMGGQRNQPNRLLLRRGDTWNQGGSLGLPKPAILDAYGSGDRPLLIFGGDRNGLTWSRSDSQTGYGVTVQNLHLRSTQIPGNIRISPATSGSAIRHCRIEGGNIVRSGSHATEGLSIENCEVSDTIKDGLFNNGAHFVWVKDTNILDCGTDTIFTHGSYFSSGRSNILFEDVLVDNANSTGNLALKFRSNRNVIVRNVETRNCRNGVSFSAKNRDTPDHAENVLVEGLVSHHMGQSNQSSGLAIGRVTNITVRNSIFYENNSSPNSGQENIWMSGVTDRTHVRIYNNVFYSNNLPDISVDSTVGSLQARNNLFLRTGNVGPNGERPFWAVGSGTDTSLLDIDHNGYYWLGKSVNQDTFGFGSNRPNTTWQEWQGLGLDAHSFYQNPGFVDPVNFDFRLLPDSPARDAGIGLPQVFVDFLGMPRPAQPNMGAYE